MSNKKILLDKWRFLSPDQQKEVLDFLESLSPNIPDKELDYHPKTELGKKLWEIRQKAIKEGKTKLLTLEEIEKELSERRG